MTFVLQHGTSSRPASPPGAGRPGGRTACVPPARTTAGAVVLLIALLFAPSSSADSWGPPATATYNSPKGKHALVVVPEKDWGNKRGHCLATLFKVEGQKHTKVWSRNLINNEAPVRVFVTDSGDYVVTMDEWGSVGKFPVVIYGRNGELIEVHSTDSLGLKEDISHIEITMSSYWWNKDSVSFFDPAEEMFLIRLHWGKWVVLELVRGELFTRNAPDFFSAELRKEHEKRWKKLDKHMQKALPEQAAALLDANEPHQRKTGTMVCGQEQYRKMIPKLRTLLTDNAYYTQGGGAKVTKVFYVRKAAKEALERMGEKVEGVVVEVPYP